MARELFVRTRRRLEAAGIEGADLEAGVLLAEAFGVSRIRAVLGDLDENPEGLCRLEDLLRRREARTPLPYLTGKAQFRSLSVKVGPGVLCPRPSTETLVEEAVRWIGSRPVRVADVGTGSGCIALAIRRACPAATVYATDIDPAALNWARRNLEGVDLLQGDLLQPLPRGLDLIVSNPPYIAADEWGQVDPEVRYEPRIALDGGPDGLHVIRRLIHEAPGWLRPGGRLLLEVGFAQADFARGLFPSSIYRDLMIIRDADDIPRVVGGVLR